MHLSVVTPLAVSFVLINKKEETHGLIYYTSHFLRDVETIYSKIEKPVYALVLSV